MNLQQQQQQQQRFQPPAMGPALPDSVIRRLPPGTVIPHTVFVCSVQVCSWFADRLGSPGIREYTKIVVITIFVTVIVIGIIALIGYCRGWCRRDDAE